MLTEKHDEGYFEWTELQEIQARRASPSNRGLGAPGEGNGAAADRPGLAVCDADGRPMQAH